MSLSKLSVSMLALAGSALSADLPSITAKVSSHFPLFLLQIFNSPTSKINR